MEYINGVKQKNKLAVSKSFTFSVSELMNNEKTMTVSMEQTLLFHIFCHNFK